MTELGERIFRKRGREIPALVAELHAIADEQVSAASRRRWHWLLGLGAITALTLYASIAGGVVVLMIAIVILIFILAAKPARRLVERLGYLEAVLTALQPELHPRARLWLRVDLRPQDHARFCTFTGTSSRGRAKKKFRQDWLALETTLADGTYLTVTQATQTKTKSGLVVAATQSIKVSGRPHPARYTVFDEGRQTQLLETHLEHAMMKLGWTPDTSRVRPAPTTRARCSLQIASTKGLPNTTVPIALVGALVAALAKQRADRGAAERAS